MLSRPRRTASVWARQLVAGPAHRPGARCAKRCGGRHTGGRLGVGPELHACQHVDSGRLVSSSCRRHHGCRAPDQQRAGIGVDHGDAQDEVGLQAEAVLGEHRLLLAPERAIEAGGCRRGHDRRRLAVDGRLDDVLERRPVFGLAEQVGEVVLWRRRRLRCAGQVNIDGNEEPDAAVDLRALPRDEVGCRRRVPEPPSRGGVTSNGTTNDVLVYVAGAAGATSPPAGSTNVNGAVSKMRVWAISFPTSVSPPAPTH